MRDDMISQLIARLNDIERQLHDLQRSEPSGAFVTLTGNQTVAGEKNLTSNIGFGQSAPQVPLHVGAGADVPATTLANILAYFTRAGVSLLVARNETADIETIFGAANTAGLFGTQSNHPLDVRVNNVTRITVGTDGSVTFSGDVNLVNTNTILRQQTGGGLNVVSTTGGLFVPRMTTTQRDAMSTQSNGLIVYNTTTNTFQVYGNGAWRTMTTT